MLKNFVYLNLWFDMEFHNNKVINDIKAKIYDNMMEMMSFHYHLPVQQLRFKKHLSHVVPSGSEITPCIKIDKPLVV